MGKETGEHKNKRCLPEIFGLKELLGGSQQDKDASVGFSLSSSILICGPSGADKTVFALSLVRQLLMQSESSKKNEPPNSWLCYVSTRGDKERLALRFSKYGWFEGKDILARRAVVLNVAETNLPQPTRGAAELINPIFTGIDRLSCLHLADRIYVIVDSLTTLLKDSNGEGDRRRYAQELISRFGKTFKDRLGLLILVGEFQLGQAAGSSAEEHVADVVFQLQSRTIGLGRRRRTLEIVKTSGFDMAKGLHSWDIISGSGASQGSQKKNCICSDEQVHSDAKNQEATCGFSRQIRASRQALASCELIEEIGFQALGQSNDGSEWCTIAIFPRPRLFPIHLLQKWDKLPKEPDNSDRRIFSGVPGLDEMLRGDVDYWVWPETSGSNLGGRENRRVCGLRQGSATLILGKSGTGKTLACLQFLLAQSTNPRKKDGLSVEKSLERSLYVNFENRPSRIRDVFPSDRKRKGWLTNCKTLYHRHADLDMNCLLAEIRYLVDRFEIERIAIDGLSDLFAELNRQEWSMLIEDLLVSLRQDRLRKFGSNLLKGKEVPLLPTILMTLETDAGLDALPTLGALSFAADNLLVLEHVIVNDVVRNTARIVKARGCPADRQTREAIVRADVEHPFQIVPGLENYRGLRSVRPMPVQIALQLIGENINEERFNKELSFRLRKLFAYPVQSFGFSRAELMRTLRDISSGTTRIPQADVKILSIDEWWIRELDPRHKWPDARDGKHALLPLETYVTCHARVDDAEDNMAPLVLSEYWIPELEKVCVPVAIENEPVVTISKELPSGNPARQSVSLGSSRRINVVAYPCYMDLGIFCLNPKIAWRKNREGNDLTSWLAEVPRAWAESDDKHWFTAPLSTHTPRTIVDMMKSSLEECGESYIGYAFDMETTSTVASAAMELCWAFGANEDFLMRDAGSIAGMLEPRDEKMLDSWARDHPLTMAFQLLMFLVVEKLMPPRTTVRDTSRAVFSRHWYSTLFPSAPGNDPLENETRIAMPFETILPVLFFPVGRLQSGGDVDMPRLVAVKDSLFRFRRLTARIRAAIAHRRPPSYAQTLRRLEEIYLEATRRLRPEELIGPLLISHVEWIRSASGDVRRMVLASDAFQVGYGGRQTAVLPQSKRPPGRKEVWAELPAAIAMDLRDALQLLNWCDFRTDLLEAELNGRSLASVIAGSTESFPAGDRREPVALTGFACAGSWMVGVDRTTHSPALAKRMIEEITSLPTTVARAENGAGIPARKDFYDFHGSEPVPSLTGLKIGGKPITWDKLLTYTVSRTYTRDRAICSRLRAGQVLEALSKHVLNCTTCASYEIGNYTSEDKRVRNDSIARLQACARNATKSVIGFVHSEMVKLTRELDKNRIAYEKGAGPCSICVNCDDCRFLEKEGGVIP